MELISFTKISVLYRSDMYYVLIQTVHRGHVTHCNICTLHQSISIYSCLLPL